MHRVSQTHHSLQVHEVGEVGHANQYTLLIIVFHCGTVVEAVTKSLDENNASSMADEDGKEVVELWLATTVNQVNPVCIAKISGFFRLFGAFHGKLIQSFTKSSSKL